MNAIKRLIDRVENQNPQRINGALIYAANAELAAQTAVIEAARPFSVLPENGKTIINLNVKFVEKLAAALAALDKVTK